MKGKAGQLQGWCCLWRGEDGLGQGLARTPYCLGLCPGHVCVGVMAQSLYAKLVLGISQLGLSEPQFHHLQSPVCFPGLPGASKIRF